MKSIIYICATPTGLLHSLSSQAGNTTWENMSQSEKEIHTIQKAQDSQPDWNTSKKATCHVFSEEMTENENPNLRIPYIRLAFHANKNARKVQQGDPVYINISIKRGHPIETCRKDGKGHTLTNPGNGYANNPSTAIRSRKRTWAKCRMYGSGAIEGIRSLHAPYEEVKKQKE